VNSECKGILDYAAYDHDHKNWFCAHTYFGEGKNTAIEGCTLESKTFYADGNFSIGEVPNGGKYVAPSWGIKAIPVGSVVVLPGCTLHAWEYPNYKGQLTTYSGKQINTMGCANHCPHYYWHDNSPYSWTGYGSFKCRCEQKYPDCTPSDSWHVINECDFTQSASGGTCFYEKQVGTSWTWSNTYEAGISVNVENTMKEGVVGFFNDKIKLSVTTHFDWTHTSANTWSTITKERIVVNVDAGLKYTIRSVKGHCGGTTVYTPMYEVISKDAQGNVVTTEDEKDFVRRMTAKHGAVAGRSVNITAIPASDI